MKGDAAKGQSAIQRVEQKFERQDDSDVSAYSHFAVIREKIPLTNDTKQVQAFKQAYDRVFAEFRQKLMEEYKLMKQSYVLEFQANYQQNQDEKQSNISEFMQTINTKEEQARDCEKAKEQNISMMQRFFEMKRRIFYYRVCMKSMKKYMKVRKEK